ncbi:MAG: hypothetical protein LBH44_10275 [Treponema sp.]|jgi:hypothetical protein|nr:hypothetical protein [Treponema sp.]
MSKEYRTTFNYLLTHRVIPNVYYANLDFFYETIITSPKNMQVFMENAMKIAADMAEKHPEIEPPFLVEEFSMIMIGDNPDTSVIVVTIPNCEKDCDCLQIAFPLMYTQARYFTCELSSNPLTDEQFFIVGEWNPEGEGLKHSNYGRLEITDEKSFGLKVREMVYGL